MVAMEVVRKGEGKRVNKAVLFRQAHSAALRYLSYRSRSRQEVRSRLRRRFSDDLVEQVINVLTEDSLIDDVQFSKQWKDSRNATNPRSAWLIKCELLNKGVDGDVAAKAVADVDDEVSAYRSGRKHASRLEGSDFATFRRKLWAYLMRRGFGGAISRRTVSQLWRELGSKED